MAFIIRRPQGVSPKLPDENEIKNTGAQKRSDNPFLVTDPATVWEDWKQRGKLVSREELEEKLAEAMQLQKQNGRK